MDKATLNAYAGLKALLDKHDRNSEEIVKEIITELKNGSQTYREVSEKLDLFEKSIRFSAVDQRKYDYLFCQVRELLGEEKNGLPLTNRS